MKKSVRASWLLLLLLLLQSLSSYAQLQGPYSQIDPTHVYKIMNRVTGRYLEVGGGGDLTEAYHPLTMWGYWGGAHQQWRFTYTNTSHYAIVSINSNACLTHDWYITSSNPSGIVQSNSGYPHPILDPQGPTTQWDLALIGNSTTGNIKAVSSRAQAGDYLTDDPNVGVKLSTDSNQIWEIIDVSADPNVYEIVNAWSGSMMQANQFNYGVSQSTGYTATYNGISPYAPSFYHWQLSAYDGNNNLNIVNRFTQQVLALDGDVTAYGSTTNIANNSGGGNQKWVLLDINDSHVLTVAEAADGRQFKIYNRISGKVLQVAGGGTDLFQEGQSINQWADNGHPWQRWYIRRVSPTGIGVAPSLVAKATASIDPTHVYKIVHHATGEALEISGGGDQTQQGRQIGVWSYWGGANQQWKLVPATYPGTNATTYAIINRNSNSAMSANAARELRQSGTGGSGGWTLDLVQTTTGLQGTISVAGALTRGTSSEKFLSGGQDENGNNPNHQTLVTADQSQQWDIIDVSTNPGVYTIINRYSTNLWLRANEDAGVVLSGGTFDARNQWSFAPQGNGYVKVISRSDQRALGIENNSPYNDSNGRVYSPGTQASENWLLRDVNNLRVLTIAEATDGRAFVLYNVSSGRALQMSGIDANGTDNTPNSYPRRANQWNYEGRAWQQWTVRYESANRMAAPTSTPAVVASVFTAYPNPVRDILMLSLPGNANPTTVKMTDIRGSAVAARYQDNGTVNVSGLAAGLYLVTVSDGQQEYHQKFTKE